METKSWATIDRSEWPEGPWDGEPDKAQWTDEATGLPCLIVRNRHYGNLCGYVGVSEGHPVFGLKYDDVRVEVHGGCTFSDFCLDGPEEHSICHVPSPGEPDRVWWIGFDCGHSDDWSPLQEKNARERGYPFDQDPYQSYKVVEYVRAECAKLARQLREMT